MMNYQFENGDTLEIDLHKMHKWQAVAYLQQKLNSIPRSVKEVVVIHGYHSGIVLQQMVRKDFHHGRIKQKYTDSNQGATYFLLH